LAAFQKFAMTAHKSLRFEGFTLDLERLCLYGVSGRLQLRRKSFDVLRYLAEHAGRVIPKDEMMKAVWPDVTVSDESLTQCISEVRRVLGSESQRLVKTIPRRGYVMDVAISADGGSEATAPLLPERPSHPGSGRIEAVSVLVADMEGFRGLPERLGERTIPLMGEYLELISSAIRAHGGTIEKFVGDAVVAFWAGPEQGIKACSASFACQTALQRSPLRRDSGSPLSVRIGINSGSAVVGNISPTNYAVMGDTANNAWLLERANKRYGTKIIVSAETRRLAGGLIYVRELDSVSVEGYGAELQIYELLGLAGGESAQPNWVSLYEAGLDAYRARDFATAIENFRTLLSVKQTDPPTELMLERCRLLLKAQNDAGDP
jgi:class 3 adenylate cyclase